MYDENNITALNNTQKNQLEQQEWPRIQDKLFFDVIKAKDSLEMKEGFFLLRSIDLVIIFGQCSCMLAYT